MIDSDFACVTAGSELCKFGKFFLLFNSLTFIQLDFGEEEGTEGLLSHSLTLEKFVSNSQPTQVCL